MEFGVVGTYEDRGRCLAFALHSGALRLVLGSWKWYIGRRYDRWLTASNKESKNKRSQHSPCPCGRLLTPQQLARGPFRFLSVTRAATRCRNSYTKSPTDRMFLPKVHFPFPLLLPFLIEAPRAHKYMSWQIQIRTMDQTPHPWTSPKATSISQSI